MFGRCGIRNYFRRSALKEFVVFIALRGKPVKYYFKISHARFVYPPSQFVIYKHRAILRCRLRMWVLGGVKSITNKQCYTYSVHLSSTYKVYFQPLHKARFYAPTYFGYLLYIMYLFKYLICVLIVPIFIHALHFNLLKTKRNLLYIRNQSVPRSKHFPPWL